MKSLQQFFVGLTDRIKDEANDTVTYRAWDKETGELVQTLRRDKTESEKSEKKR